ncbi:Sugar phosphate permease [Nonlabens sp. Hel1_33_55]|uniref:MFS transporter n=1 Tax=Nonlabens sp. Hel1_33_55 TaxID=1336802 RepID=UPI000875AE40|nr:MFS transporter [Nonlabens sp. Hel1_33_55]SCY05457.1 Sugar phosphate permease [Nonlabens sp. Hel1_33_55]
MNSRFTNWLNIILLILAGEAVFILPFVLPRIFRPTVLEVFNLTNVELGALFSTYGIVAFFSYLFGGSIADKYPPKYLISVALMLTAAGGLVLASYPSFWTLQLLYGYWGFTTIFLFWAAMLKATRVTGGANRQGLAFGLLDGGRGLVAAGFGSLGIFVLSIFMADNVTLDPQNQADSFQKVIIVFSAVIASVGILVALLLKSTNRAEKLQVTHWKDLITNFKIVIKIRSVWLLMIIILCAYVGYKITDVFSLYANDVMGYDEIESAGVGTFMLYIRPFVGVGVGLLADKTKTSLMMIIGFMLSIVGCILFASGIINENLGTLFIVSILITATGVYAFRTLYFAAMQEGHIPLVMTGTAIGLISLVGYTPDIFMGPAIGYFLDGWPGELGHQYVFAMCAAFMVVGLCAAIVFNRTTKISLGK